MKEKDFLQPKVSVKQKIALILFGLFLFLVLLEASLRLGGFILVSVQEHRNLQSIKQKGAYRILCLGESTTQDQYPQFLGQVLNQRNIGVHFSVIDKGRWGKNTSVILNHIESYLDKYHPDMVVAMMGINDWGDHIPFEAVTTSKRILFIRSFRTYKLIKLLWLHILTKTKEIGLYKSSHNKEVFEKVQTDLSKIELKELPIKSIPMGGIPEKIMKLSHAYVELGESYCHQGKFSEAENSFKKAVGLNPKNDIAYVGLGALYQNQGKLSEADNLFRRAIELNPKNDSVYIGLGKLYQNQGKLSEAEDLFRRIIEANPKDDAAYTELGTLYQNQGKLSEAEDLFKKAVELSPSKIMTYVALGWSYKRQGKLSEAEDLFRRIIEANPKIDRAYAAIAVFYEEMGKLELAKEYAEKANRLRLEYYTPATIDNYRKLKEILDKRGIKLVCVQYPMRNVESLKKIFAQDGSIVFVDNENIFKEALKKADYEEYFEDRSGGDFGHCTEKGNRLLAQNIADVILRENFKITK